jgi:hypothetical protein
MESSTFDCGITYDGDKVMLNNDVIISTRPYKLIIAKYNLDYTEILLIYDIKREMNLETAFMAICYNIESKSKEHETLFMAIIYNIKSGSKEYIYNLNISYIDIFDKTKVYLDGYNIYFPLDDTPIFDKIWYRNKPPVDNDTKYKIKFYDPSEKKILNNGNMTKSAKFK